MYDVTGAGDTVISVMAASLAAQTDMVQAATLANVAAGLVVRALGAEAVSVPELQRALQHSFGIVRFVYAGPCPPTFFPSFFPSLSP